MTVNTVSAQNPVEFHAILLDQFVDNDEQILLPCGLEFKEKLNEMGWLDEQITTFFGETNATEIAIRSKLAELQETIDENDLFFFYIFGHGKTFLDDVLDMEDWLYEELVEIDTDNKIILIEACHSGSFADEIKRIPGFILSSVAKNEYSIGITSEQVDWPLSEPRFEGAMPSHFWITRLNDSRADTSQDGVVSMMELYKYTLPEIRQSFKEFMLFYPDWAEETLGVSDPNRQTYPNPVLHNNLLYSISLNTSHFIANIESFLKAKPIFYASIFGGSTGLLLIIGAGLLYIRHRRKKISRD